jgi:hypothetical protein
MRQLNGQRSTNFGGVTLRPLLVAALAIFAASHVSAQWVQRSYTLVPGWNAIFLDVQPEPADCDTLFAGLPIESVWDFNASVDAPQFVQDPTTLIPGSPNWLTWFPPTSPAASTANLFILRDGRPFLIKLADTAPLTTWTVTGRPSLRKITWRPGGVNFVGFHVGPSGPTFSTLFAGEAGLSGQPVYRLNSSGAWTAVTSPSTTRPVSGVAYWVRCNAPAQRTATIEVDAGSRQGLTFTGDLITESALRIRNTSSGNRNITLRLLDSATPPSGQPADAGLIPLDYWRQDYANVDIGWQSFPTALSHLALSPGAEWNVRLGIRLPPGAAGMPGATYQGLIEASDDLGSRWLIPVSAEGAAAAQAARIPRLNGVNDSPYAGLWVGDAVIKSVSQPANPGNPNALRTAGGEFSFRLIVHVDAAGNSRLLQRAYLVRKPPVLVSDPDNPGFNIVAQPARTIVATDDSLIPSLIGAGEIIGRRLSSVAFGFNAPQLLSGGPFGSGTLTAGLVLDYNHPLNPFKHLYHPDHNNLDERFEQTLPEGRESFTVTRNAVLEFTGVDPLGLNPPGWGATELGGNYRESIAGLHRSTLQIAGTFRLTRIATAPALNQ